MTSYEHKVKNIYLWESWWRPGVNTIAYYEFNDNLEDSTENNNDLSISSGTASYQTVWNKKAFNINNDGTSTSYIEISQDLPTNLTVSVWCYFRQVTSSTYTKTLLRVQTANALNARICAVPSRIYFWDNVDARIDNPTRNRRYYITMVRWNDWLYSYIDWSFIYKGQVAIQNIIYNLWWWTWTGKWDGMLSELIIESKARTAEEISEYYETTKSNYWL